MHLLRLALVTLLVAGCASTREVHVVWNDDGLETLRRASGHVDRIESPLVGSLLTDHGGFRIDPDSVQYIDSRGISASLPTNSLRTVEISRRRTGNGAVWGAVVGGAAGLSTVAFAYGLAQAVDYSLGGDDEYRPSFGQLAAGFTAVGLIGAGVGALIGSRNRRVTVYRIGRMGDLTVGSNGLSLRMSLPP